MVEDSYRITRPEPNLWHEFKRREIKPKTKSELVERIVFIVWWKYIRHLGKVGLAMKKIDPLWIYL